MKKIVKYTVVIIFSLILFNGCEDFLDTKSYTEKDTSSFPKNPGDASQMLTGVYTMLNHTAGDYYSIAELTCDDRFGGGGSNDPYWQGLNHLMYSQPNNMEWYWNNRYRGISRANDFLLAMETMDDFDSKSQLIGEAKILRANWYFELVQVLGNVPLVLASPASADEAKKSPPQATQEEIFKQIGTDLWEAYNEMPNVKYNTFADGHTTKWAAAGLLARVYLFYTGFYNKADLPREGGAVTKSDVVAALEVLIKDSGHDLLEDYRQLWSYSNVASMDDYPFVSDMKDKGLNWLEGSTNKETIFVTKYTNIGEWWTPSTNRGTNQYSNQTITCSGLRGQKNITSFFPFTQGWGMGPVNTNLWSQWLSDDASDMRRKASILNINDPDGDEGFKPDDWTWGGDTQMEETGLWQKKVMAVGAYKNGNLLDSFMSHPLYQNSPRNDYQLEHGTDMIRLRFADVLLMHSELTETADGMNKVRKRAGLSDIAYSLPALQKERRYELAFEGLRWGDIRRWGIAETELAKMYGVDIYNNEKKMKMKEQTPGGVAQRYKDTKGFYMIPETEMMKANGEYVQNPGWENPNTRFTSWRE